MGFLKHFRKKKSRSKDFQHESKHNYSQSDSYHHQYSAPRRDYTRCLPDNVLQNIFAQLCPHALDGSLSSAEESMTDDGCMLCDMRDLAHCVLACKKWYRQAQPILYQHVRIDAVHYCELEIKLSAMRKKNSFIAHNIEPQDPPRGRLILFMRTVREAQHLANLVLSLRMPYMAREACKVELARTVSVLPNLRYVDLPTGFFSDDASSFTLKQELVARCPEIRRMKYTRGAERSFAMIPRARTWMNLEVLELVKLDVEPNILLLALNSFPRLKDLKLEQLQWLEDPVFKPLPSLPQFPPIQRLTLQDIPKITARGLATYLSFPQNRDALKHLKLNNTGVRAETLHEILTRAPHLSSLSIQQDVTRPFPMEDIPPLASRSLILLHYEITSESGRYGIQPVSASYYSYLMSSLLSGSLPALVDLYVRDAHFPDTLLLAPPPRFGNTNGTSRTQGLNQSLSVYSKGLDELEWNFTSYEPFAPAGRRGSVTRPVSFHGAQLSPAWGGEARKSVLVGNGFGGFLAVPADEERPKSSSGWRNSTAKKDLWR
ncbi:hypothetical protein AJ80_03692 [Polytolypa hystricis UAMH7299]|uniref:Uncharacterized protein n=1 Tax=Polytolypa hystricis (strain UAMH7299) TaxID=1447883 RepID=A0A2B7Y7R2_POLH7|nr:hypothetical protein AJ80_03692 [Polytolypa hystricis UAMH7299]